MPCEVCPDAGICDVSPFPACVGDTGTEPEEIAEQSAKEDYMPEETKTIESRVRMNLSQNAKGLVQLDITAEFPSAIEAAAELGKAIDLARDVCAEKGLQLVTAA